MTAQTPVNDPVLPVILVGSVYQHYKGGFYKVIALAVMEHDQTEVVVYQRCFVSLPGPVWVRPRSEWFEDVGDGVTRYTREGMA